MTTFTDNVIRFRISNSVTTLSNSLKFDRRVVDLARTILGDLQLYLKCRTELFLFATALFDMANAQSCLEIAEAEIGLLRQHHIQRSSEYNEIELMAVNRATDLCKQREAETRAAYKHLEYRIQRLMERVQNAESQTQSR